MFVFTGFGEIFEFLNVFKRNQSYQNTFGIRLEGTQYPQIDTVAIERMQFVYQGKKSARWYIREYAGGFAPDADKRSVAVAYPSGQVDGNKRVLYLFNDMPTVLNGGEIVIAKKLEQKTEKEKKEVEALLSTGMPATKIAEKLDIEKILKRASEDWDGGYAMAGLLGHGDAFVLRDPSGIRPAFWYEDDEVCVVASERPVIQTAFNLKTEEIQELKPGHALIIKKNGSIKETLINKPKEELKCSFERIYFSRGSDQDIYKERKQLGKNIVPQIIDSIDNDLDNSVFSFIPNTAEVSFYGMIKGLEDHLNEEKIGKIIDLGPTPNPNDIREILLKRARIEKIAIKDAKLRTFITQDDSRDDLVAHVYDITYGSVKRQKDNLVIIDDSIVRGTTLKQSILRILDRLEPKKIVVVSSAPQIRYPDCYGIDMAKMGDFIAFEAAIALLTERNMTGIIEDVYKKCKDQENLPKEQIKNYVQEIYMPFTNEEISAKISQLLRPDMINAEVEIIYQTVENLHLACPNNKGDWYFTGNYPTPGGNKVCNKAFVNYIEGKNVRGY